MAAEHRSVGDDHMITEYRVMTDVRISHQQIVRAEPGWLSGIIRPVNGHVLSNHVVVPHSHARQFALEP